MTPVLTVAALTIRETQRRRILWVALLMGAAFLIVFGLGFHFILADIEESAPLVGGSFEYAPQVVSFLRMAGLYAIYFLSIAMAALISANTISGEIESHTIETMVTKPIPRWSIVLGKWLGLALIIVVYTILFSTGLVAIIYLRSGYGVTDWWSGLAVMCLGVLTMLSLTILGGTRLSTLANGALAFMLYGVAFIGGWVEQIGSLLRNETAVDLGILSSLFMPADVLWKYAASLFQSTNLLSDLNFSGPFIIGSQPSDSVIFYGLFYIVAMLALAMWSFTRRDL